MQNIKLFVMSEIAKRNKVPYNEYEKLQVSVKRTFKHEK